MHEEPRPPPEERFHANVIGLGELVYDIVKKVNATGNFIINPELVKITICILDKLDHTTIIDTFIHKSTYNKSNEALPFEEHCWTKIHEKDKSFFLENAGEIFGDLQMNRVDAFSRMFGANDEHGNPIVPERDEEEIWEYFKSLVKITIKYIHEKRQPKLLRRGSEEIRRYEKDDFFSDVDIARHADLWKIQFHFPQ